MLTAVVTGGSRGIGRAVVEALAGSGYSVHFLYRIREDAAAHVVKVVAERGGPIAMKSGRRSVLPLAVSIISTERTRC